MRNTSSAFKQELENDNRRYYEYADFTLTNGTTLNLTNENFWENGFSLEESVSSGSELQIGSAIINKATLILNNIYEDFDEYDFFGATVRLRVGLLVNNNVEIIDLGQFTVVNQPVYNGSLITIELYDNMYKFDRAYSDSSLVYPATLDTIVRDACTVCGVNLITTNFPNKSFTVESRPEDDAITFREVIAYAAQIAGCYARCNPNGYLCIDWFDEDALESALNANTDYIELKEYFNTISGMDSVVSARQDDATNTVSGVDWFSFNGKTATNIYVNSNSWYVFGGNAPSSSSSSYSAELNIYKRDGQLLNLYKQTGTVGNTSFMKFRYEGYTAYQTTNQTDEYRLVYELFLLSDGAMVLNVIQIPTNTSYLGTSSIAVSAGTTTLTLGVGQFLFTRNATTGLWQSESFTASGYDTISSIYNMQLAVDDVVITGVKVSMDVEHEEIVEGHTQTIYEKAEHLDGSEGYVIAIEDNPLIAEDQIETVATYLGGRLNGFSFRTGDITHGSDPAIEAGDVALVIDRKGKKYGILVSETIFAVGNAQQTRSIAEDPVRNTSARFSAETKNYVQMRKLLADEKSARELMAEDLERRISEAQGLYETQVPDGQGGTIIYLHDKPILGESDIRIQVSTVGVVVTANGTDPNPTWYGLTVDGQLIASILSVDGIHADWINTGQLVIRKNGSEVFFADVDTGTVRISGNSISITAGDTIDTAITNTASTTTRTILDTANAYGLGWKVNYTSFTSASNGECYYHGYNADGTAADTNGWVLWNGAKLAIPKGGYINPNSTMPFDATLYSVYRTSNQTFHDVTWVESSGQWEANTYSGTTPSSRTAWSWAESTDVILASYSLPSAEGAIYAAQLFTPPRKYSELPEKLEGKITSVSDRVTVLETETVSYELSVSNAAVKKDSDGIYEPTSITVSATAQIIGEDMSAYSGRFKIEVKQNNSWSASYTSSSNESSKTWTIPANTEQIRVSLYKAGGTTTLLDQQVIPIVSDGKDGTNGTNGTDGEDAYTVILTNENHTFAGTSSAAIASSTTCNVIAYKGADQVSATIGTISGAPTGMSTSITSNGTTSAYFTVTVTTSMVTRNGVLTVPVTVDGKTFNMKFTYSLALNGVAGLNNATVALYQRSTSTPNKPSSSLTYTFSTGVLSGSLGSWTQSIPTGTNPVWMIVATASSTDTTDTIASSEWSAQTKIVENGTNGTNGIDGFNQATIFLYQRKDSTPSRPSGSLTYTFSTGQLSSIPTGWSREIPDNDGNPCYVTTAVAVSQSATATIASSSWSDVVKLVKDGTLGRNYLCGTANPFVASVECSTGSTSKDFIGIASTYADQTLEDLGFVAGNKVIFSFDWKFDEIQGATTSYGSIIVYAHGKTSSSNYGSIGQITNTQEISPSATNLSGHFEKVITLASTQLGLKAFTIRLKDMVGTVTISHFKLERGDTATEWQPAPEDGSIASNGSNILRGTNVLESFVSTKLWDNGNWGAINTSEGTATLIDIADNLVKRINRGVKFETTSYVQSIASTLTISQIDIPQMKVGSFYTVSCYAKGTGYLSFGIGVSSYYLDDRIYLDGVTDWTRYSRTFALPNNSNYVDLTTKKTKAFFGSTGVNCNVSICGMKLEEGIAVTEWIQASEDIEDSIVDYATSLGDQIDGKAETFYQTNDPSTAWNTTDLKNQHKGDLWYNSTSSVQKYYRWSGTAWVEITATPPSGVFDVIDGKATVFVSTPTTPYTVGDLWFNSSTSDIMTCTTSRASGSYNSSDWEKRNKYTDDTALSTFLSGTYATDKTDLQSQIDGKAETWYQSNDPSSAWTTTALKTQHTGDLWYKTTDNTTWYYNGTQWVEQNVPTTVFDQLDGKANVFTSQPTPPYAVGDLWFNDATSNIMVCKTARSSGSYTASDWEKRDKYTDDALATTVQTMVQSTYGTCSTESDTAEKVVTLSGFTLYKGARIVVTFTYSNAVASPRLNVNGTGAKYIRAYGASLTATSKYAWVAGSSVEFIYDGTYWQVVDSGITDKASVYATCNTAEGTANKVVSYSKFTLYEGVRITVRFTYANTAANPTLNVNSTGAKAIWAKGAALDAKYYWTAKSEITFTYDGTHWIAEVKDQEEVFNSLTNGGTAQGIFMQNGQLYINMTYLQTGTLKIGGASNGNGILEVLDSSGTRVGRWDNGALYVGNISSSLSSPNTKIASDGAVTTKSLTANDYVYVDGNNTSLINIPIYSSGSATTASGYAKLYKYGYEFKCDSSTYLFFGYPPSNSSGSSRTSNVPFALSNKSYLDSSSGYYIEAQPTDFILRYNSTNRVLLKGNDSTYSGYFNGISNNGKITSTNGAVQITGNFTVLSGTKSRAVITEDYGKRLLYCYETPSPLFGDVGEGTIAEDGKCYVFVDSIFAETVTLAQYQVFLQTYGNGTAYVSERNQNYFVVEGTPNLSFGWELKAKQSDFDQFRFDRFDETDPEKTDTDYGTLSADHVEELREGRLSA